MITLKLGFESNVFLFELLRLFVPVCVIINCPLQFGKLAVLRFCRNRTAENLYGYSVAEALGRGPVELLVDPIDFGVANDIMQRVGQGQSWTGQFPVKNKMGDRFSVIATNTPLYDDNGILIGSICESTDSQPFQEKRVPLMDARNSEHSFWPRSSVTTKLGLDPQQPLQSAIASKITNLVSFVLLIVPWFIIAGHMFIIATETGIQGEQQS